MIELPLLYPVTTEIDKDHDDYKSAIADFYAAVGRRGRGASRRRPHGRGAERRRSAVLRLLHASACPAGASLSDRGHPRRHRHVGLLVGRPACRSSRATTCCPCCPARMAEAELTRRLADTDAAVIMKVGRNLPKIRRALAGGRQARRRPSMSSAAPWPTPASMRLADKPDDAAPYFALVLVPGWERPAMSGRLAVIGLGPGQRRPGDAGGLRRPCAAATRILRLRALSRPAAARAATRPRIASDNREELVARRRRAGHGPPRASTSPWSPAAIPASSPWRRRSARRSRPGRPAWRDVELDVVPGVTAMLAVAARIGAPLGHDFCAISLSDNLKPWELIEQPPRRRRRRPASSSRSTIRSARRGPGSSAAPSSCLRGNLPGNDAGDLRPRRRPARRAHRQSCRSARPIRPSADMATCVIIGSAETRIIERGDRPPLVYTPRFFDGRQQMIDQSPAPPRQLADGLDAGRRRPAHQHDLDAERRAPPRSWRRWRRRRCSWRR